MITATSASANASGNQRSNHSDKCRPEAASQDPTDASSVFMVRDSIAIESEIGRILHLKTEIGQSQIGLSPICYFEISGSEMHWIRPISNLSSGSTPPVLRSEFHARSTT